ncbi:hypothetical protein [Nocardioides litoris]|uniref:hypothetical protein n=1 Tax=Nocardioides litoris TaxID=1926648 RepID=UPI001121F868|nr:hypothetical protein [Nocardioides litoris]
MTIVGHTPELLYSETTAGIARHRGHARRQAAAGDALGAVAATWAADLGIVQAVMWERVMFAAPDPDQQLLEITATVARAFAAAGRDAEPGDTASAAATVRAARRALAGAFEPSALALMERRFTPLAHLEALPAPTAHDVAEVARQRLGDLAPEAAVAERDQEAADCMAAARDLVRDGRPEDALALAWQADWATLEAYLIDAALAVGDTALLSVELRWALAAAETETIGSLPADLDRAVGTVRDHLVRALGSVEGDRLRRRFQPLPG